MKLIPINSHLLIEPLVHKTFLPSERETYEEIGIVIECAPELILKDSPLWPQKGDRVYFDSWLAAKYPKPNSENDDEFYWLVPFKDIRAVEKKDGNEIPE
jgi:hypothetical protein